MALLKQPEMSKELVVNVLQQNNGKDGETVQIRIESAPADGVHMENEVHTDEARDDEDDEVEEVHENLEISEVSYENRDSLSEEQPSRSSNNVSRYHKYRQRWRSTWLEMPEFQGWLTRNDSTRNAHCLLCKRDIRGSMTMIRRHAMTGKHIDNISNFGTVFRQQGGSKTQNVRYMIEQSDGSVSTTHGESQLLLVSPMDGTQASAVFVNQDETHLESETFNGVINEDDYQPVDSGEVFVTIRRTEEFSACHRLHSTDLSSFKNQEIFGKCNNVNGHGHNYKMVVALTGPIDKTTGMVMNLAELKKIIQSNVIDIVDHKNLDLDVPYFKNVVSTVENIAIFIWRQLRPVIDQKIHIRVTVHETDKNEAIFPALI